MGQNRTDTSNQLAAKQRVADKRKCKECGRRSAMSTPITLVNEYGDPVGRERTCLYCGAVVARAEGKTFRFPKDQPPPDYDWR